MVYVVFCLFYFENILNYSNLNKIIGFSVLSNVQVKFYNFFDASVKNKMILFIITYAYYGIRFYLKFKEIPFKYIESEMYPTMVAFVSVIFISTFYY